MKREKSGGGLKEVLIASTNMRYNFTERDRNCLNKIFRNASILYFLFSIFNSILKQMNAVYPCFLFGIMFREDSTHQRRFNHQKPTTFHQNALLFSLFMARDLRFNSITLLLLAASWACCSPTVTHYCAPADHQKNATTHNTRI